MQEWIELFEIEKQKLNELGNESFVSGIPLHENKALQAQSRKLDELVIQFHKRVI
ncbi:aspartyl-phosphate phosphatase Spo0E family protein [Paenibacillus sp. FSL W8-0186]|uniref:aspartyl-phosphate phosphatase Spo0E family protein n=1 Tax=Paenibacillus sp. FSL W8-0186 TaxID=2921709 RepID=UPI0030D041CD